MTPARLRIVESPEQELARLFEREREIIAGLAAVRGTGARAAGFPRTGGSLAVLAG